MLFTGCNIYHYLFVLPPDEMTGANAIYRFRHDYYHVRHYLAVNRAVIMANSALCAAMYLCVYMQQSTINTYNNYPMSKSLPIL